MVVALACIEALVVVVLAYILVVVASFGPLVEVAF